MPVKKMLGLALLFLPLTIFLCLFVSSNSYADVARDMAQEMVFAELQNPAAVPSEAYRQELGKAVVIQEEPYAHEIDSRTRFMPGTRAKSQSGNVGLISSSAEYSYQVKAFGKIPLEFAVGSKYIGINNSTAVKLPARLTTVSFGAQATLPFFNFDKTYFVIGLAPSFFTDNWNFRTGSFHLIQRYFMIYQPTEKWTFVLGAQYEPGFRPAVSPIAGLIYKPNDRLTFNLIPDNPEIAYKLNEKWTVFAEGAWISEEYKVTQDNLKNLVLGYNEIRAGGGLRYTLNKYIEGSLSLGGVFDHSLVYRHDRYGKVALQNGLYTEFCLSITM